MPDPRLIGLTALDSLTVESCNKLKTLPKGLGKLGALKQLTLLELDQLQEMPDLIGLTALDSLTIVNCFKLKKPRPPPSPDPSGRRGACAKTLVRSHGEGQR
jgi:hypothetical protein